MFSCYAPEKKSKKQNVNDLEDNKNKSDISNDDISNIHMDNLKKMDENALHKLKTKINCEYRTVLYENQINNDKIILYKKLIEQYKKTVNEDDEDNTDNINNFIEARNSILEKEILEMKNKNNDLHKEYLSLFDSLSLLTDPYSKVSRLTEKIYILENKLKEQEYKLQYLEERTKYYSNYKNVDDNLTKDIFLELFENKNEDDNLNLIEEKSSESSSSSSSSEETEKSKEPINTISNNVGDIKESNKLTTHNTIPKEAVEDYKRMLGLIYKKNYEQITKEYQKVISAAQSELLIKNNNLKKLNLIKNEIEMMKDPSKKLKIINEEEKINNEKRNKEKEKKLEFKKNKKNYLDKSEEYEELKKNLESLNEELKKEEEEYNNIEKTFKENNDTLNDKIKEGNQIEVELEDIKKQRDLLLEELFGKKYNNYNGIIEKKNDNEGNS